MPVGRGRHRINAHPQTEAEWAAIDAEIDQIRALNPNNWLGEYLRNRAVGAPGRPEEAAGPAGPWSGPPRPRSPPSIARSAPPRTRPRRAARRPGPSPPAAARPAGPGGSPIGRWQIRDTANFRIYHVDPALAEKVAQVGRVGPRPADQAMVQRHGPRQNWQPQCEIYLYPTARQYAQMTGQPEDSPGFSTMGMNGGRIISRRVNLRADHPTLVQAVLPHEITHVILADIFPTQQVPRWADEGLAVLSEPADEQQRRAADLIEPLAANRLFPLDALMSMDYPDNRYWSCTTPRASR